MVPRRREFRDHDVELESSWLDRRCRERRMSWSCEMGESKDADGGRSSCWRSDGQAESRAERIRGVVTRRTIMALIILLE